MCFALHRRALFLTSQLPQVLREWCALYILTSKCASRHNGAPATLASLLFDPPEPQNIGKHVFRDFSAFSRTLIFFLLPFSSLIFFLRPFSSLTLPTSPSIILYYTILYYTILYYIILYYITLYYIRLYYVCIMLCHIVLYSVILYCLVLCCVVLCYIVLYCGICDVILYCIMLSYIVFCYVTLYCIYSYTI